MSKYRKSPLSYYLKNVRTSYPVNVSTREPYASINERLTGKEFKYVLPLVPKDYISGKGANESIAYPCIEDMNVMINCLKRSDYNQAPCQVEIKTFDECYKKFVVEKEKADERARKGIFNVKENQRNFPIKFKQKMNDLYKWPRKVDNGPDIPFK